MSRHRVIIVGAGLAGLACANELSRAGIPFRIVDKGRGAGGRCSSRRSSFGRFDHGAPRFGVTDARFKKAVDGWEDRGLVAAFGEQDGAPAYIGTPAMNSFIRHEAERLDVEFGLEIGAPLKRNGQYGLYTTYGEPVGDAEFIVFAAPAPQTADRLPRSDLRDGPKHVNFDPDWTAMVAWDEGSDLPDLGSGSLPDSIASVEWQDELPERSRGPRVVIHATLEWTLEHLDLEKPGAASRLVYDLKKHVGGFPDPAHVEGHRWRYARVRNAIGTSFGFDTSLQLATCGDWHLGPNCEDAWLSGYLLGRALVDELS
ncbi:MAG: NAD(P)-binding protein [Parvularculaceae bacterium]|nr:NAD(P)-binding protein [Parvularculaceae bacterium]